MWSFGAVFHPTIETYSEPPLSSFIIVEYHRRSLRAQLYSVFVPFPVFATWQSVCPEPGRGRTAVCRPVRSFSKVARQVGLEDEDGRHFVVPSGHFLKLPDK